MSVRSKFFMTVARHYSKWKELHSGYIQTVLYYLHAGKGQICVFLLIFAKPVEKDFIIHLFLGRINVVYVQRQLTKGKAEIDNTFKLALVVQNFFFTIRIEI